MKLKIILTGFILSLFLTLSYNSTTLNNPPKVEIISPVNDSIIHEKFANFSIKCSDDTYVISLIIEYGDLDGNGGIAIGLKNKTYFFNFTHYASPGYNWMVATAYDEFGNYGQNISIYYYETPKKPYPQGKPPSVKIISPSNGEVIYSRDAKVLVECKSDKNIVAVSYAWGGKNGGGGGSESVLSPSTNYTFYFFPYRVYPGYNWVYAFAYDEERNIGYDHVVYYYNTSKDCYPPEIEIWWPPVGQLIIFNRIICDLPYNFSIVVGNFKFLASAIDNEEHLQKMQLYLDDEIVVDKECGGLSDIIYWDCNKLLFGWYRLRITAIDSFNNFAEKEQIYFIINFL